MTLLEAICQIIDFSGATKGFSLLFSHMQSYSPRPVHTLKYVKMMELPFNCLGLKHLICCQKASKEVKLCIWVWRAVWLVTADKAQVSPVTSNGTVVSQWFNHHHISVVYTWFSYCNITSAVKQANLLSSATVKQPSEQPDTPGILIVVSKNHGYRFQMLAL